MTGRLAVADETAPGSLQEGRIMNRTDEIRGMFSPLPTVFDGQGGVDAPVMEELVDWYLEAGVNAFFVLGSFGQGPACTVEQRKQVTELAVRRVRGRIPVVIHIG